MVYATDFLKTQKLKGFEHHMETKTPLSPLKRVAAINDLSGVGRCSLTVALPIISAASIECSCMPTTVLSTHTGEFTGYTFRDLSQDMIPMAQHWKNESISFDAIYTGYLCSCEQVDNVIRIIEILKSKDTMVLVDPVFGDKGKLYTGFNTKTVQCIAGLCKHADIIVPNMTEAYYMLGQPYKSNNMTTLQVEKLLYELAELGSQKIVLTGVHFDNQHLGAACFDAKTNRVDFLLNDYVPGYFHGSGDVFASSLLGAILNGHSLQDSTQIAVDFTYMAIKLTSKDPSPRRMGLRFEPLLKDYIQLLKK